MSKSKPGLGRGFDALIPTHLVEEEFDPTATTDKSVSRARDIALKDIHPNPEQPRKSFTKQSLDELATSIKAHGVLQPLIVCEDTRSSGYLLIAGERRWRAAQVAELTSVPAIVRSLSDQAQLEVALIENLQREDLNPLEVATALLKLNEQFNMTREEIGKHVGKSAPAVSNTIRLLGLPKEAKEALADAKISEGHARAILAVPEDERKEFLGLIIKNGWSVRRAEQFVTALKQGEQHNGKAKSGGAEHQTEYTKKLSKVLKAEVRDRPMAKGSGRLVINYKDADDRDRIISQLSQ